MRIRRIVIALAVAFSCAAPETWAAGLPRQIGDCVVTRVKALSNRIEGVPDSGSAISFEIGGFQDSYERVPEMENSRPGDVVKMCLVFIPDDCPPGDTRGRRYRVFNRRTNENWIGSDGEHMCGGA